jgi:hypothetical protein
MSLETMMLSLSTMAHIYPLNTYGNGKYVRILMNFI